jgi:hypothetical protein
MNRYRVSYAFTQSRMCRRDELANELREISYGSAFEQLADPTKLAIAQLGPDLFEISYPVEVVSEADAGSMKDAIRSFLYRSVLPDDIDVTRIRCEELGAPPAGEGEAVEAA